MLLFHFIARKRFVRVCASTDTQSSTAAFESPNPTAIDKKDYHEDWLKRKDKKRKDKKKPLINKTEFIFNSKKSKEKKNAREARKKTKKKREAHFRRMMRNGTWNKRFDYDDNNYADDQNAGNDEQYNRHNTNYHEHAINRSENEEIKRKGSIESEGKHSMFLLLKGLQWGGNFTSNKTCILIILYTRN